MDEALDILTQFGALDDGQGPVAASSLRVVPLAGGLINTTFALGRSFVLQRLSPIFSAAVNTDIAALVPVLRRGGVPVPDLVRTESGALWASPTGSSDVWRLLTRLPGDTRHKLTGPREAAAAGAMFARFHLALAPLASYEFAFTRPGAHDTDRHMATLTAAIDSHRGHRLHDAVAALAEPLLAQWAAFGPTPVLPRRIIHGDPKVSNLLWSGDQVCGVIDLDTMAWSGVDIELGDALRSWCNRGLEDDPEPEFAVSIFEAAVSAYLARARSILTDAERGAIAPATERIALELAARFAADALNEQYFGWAPARFPGRGEHNLVRARNQLGLARAARRLRPELEAIVDRQTA